MAKKDNNITINLPKAPKPGEIITISNNTNAGQVLISSGNGASWGYSNSYSNSAPTPPWSFDNKDSLYILGSFFYSLHIRNDTDEISMFNSSFFNSIKDFIIQNNLYTDLKTLFTLQADLTRFIIDNDIDNLKDVPTELITLLKMTVLRRVDR